MEQMELFKDEGFEDVGAKTTGKEAVFAFVREGEVVLELTPDEANLVRMAIGEFLDGLKVGQNGRE